MAGTVVADTLQADSTSTLVLKNGVANTPPTIQDSAGTQIGTFCRAWVNFNGTGTVAIRASFNVTSITDNGTGDYTINFTTAMPDANYSVSGAAMIAVGSVALFFAPTTSAPTTSTLRVVTTSSTFTLTDAAYTQVAIFR
jgi:hypothetical protein